MERWANKIAVVTGASSGIGAAIAKEFVKAGLIVVGLARRVEKIEALKGDLPMHLRQNLHAYKCDLTQRDAVNGAFEWITQKWGGVDVLVNNAGISRSGQLVSLELEQLNEVVQTNLMSVVHCTRHAFASMKERNVQGHVFIVNSVGGHQVFRFNELPTTNLYCPTKFALTAVTELYRQEFHYLGSKVKITTISPGLVATEMVSEEIAEKADKAILQPEDVAQCVVFALSTPPHVQIHEVIVKPMGETMF